MNMEFSGLYVILLEFTYPLKGNQDSLLTEKIRGLFLQCTQHEGTSSPNAVLFHHLCHRVCDWSCLHGFKCGCFLHLSSDM